jgi:phage baseplate assembly protein W
MAILTTLPKEMTANGLTSGQIPGSGGLTSVVLSTGVLQVDYFLEERDRISGNVLVPLPSQPQTVEVRRIYSENTIYTFDPTFSFRELAAPRVIEVTMSGQTGVGLRLGINDEGKLAYTEGYNHLSSFEKFIDKYMHKVSTYSSTNDQFMAGAMLSKRTSYEALPYMVFRGIKENIHGRCEIKSLEYARDVGKNRLGSFSWQLTLVVYDTAKATNPTGFDFMDWADSAVGFVNSVTGLSEAVMGGIQAGVGQVARNVGDIGTAVGGLATSLSEIDDRIYGTIQAVATAANKVLDGFDALAGLIDADVWKRDATNFVDGLETQVVDAWTIRDFCDHELANVYSNDADYSWDEIKSEAVDFETTASALTMSEMMYQSWLLMGVTNTERNRELSYDEVVGFLKRGIAFGALASLDSSASNAPEVRNFSDGYSFRYEMRSGQSLLTIANHFLGSPELWVDIANLNGMPDAYTKSDGTILMSGDAIFIPTDNSSGAWSFTTTEPSGVEDIIGLDIGWTNDHDINFDPFSGDFMLVDGVENLSQTIERILKTTTGEVTMDPNYGLNFAIIGSAINEIAVTLISNKIRERLLQDARILDVVNIKAAVDPNKSDLLNISLTCVCVGQNDIVVNTDLQTQ